MLYSTLLSCDKKYSHNFTIASPTEPSKEAAPCNKQLSIKNIIQFFVSTEKYGFWGLERFSTHAFNFYPLPQQKQVNLKSSKVALSCCQFV